MIPIYVVTGVVVMWGVWTGATRVAAQSFRPLLVAFAMLLAGAGACWLIASQKTGHAYAGLLGVLLSLLLLLAAGSVTFGAVLHGVHHAIRRRGDPDPQKATSPPWDIWGLSALSALAVIGSLLE